MIHNKQAMQLLSELTKEEKVHLAASYELSEGVIDLLLLEQHLQINERLLVHSFLSMNPEHFVRLFEKMSFGFILNHLCEWSYHEERVYEVINYCLKETRESLTLQFKERKEEPPL